MPCPPTSGTGERDDGLSPAASLAYTFVERLVELQNHRRRKGDGCTFYHADVAGILAHPYVAPSATPATHAPMHDEEIVRDRRIFCRRRMAGPQRPAETDLYARRDVARVVRLHAGRGRRRGASPTRATTHGSAVGIPGGHFAEQVTKLAQLARRVRHRVYGRGLHLAAAPALADAAHPTRASRSKGMQVMGILETRNLDFENVVLLSMNDDNFPGNHMAQASFVPYNLRAAYELPTPEHHEGVYAYYFYRLIQRAKTVHGCSTARTPTTNRRANRAATSTSSTTRADSRPKVEVGVDVNLAETAPIEVAKDDDGDHAASRTLHRPRKGHALADGFLPLCGLSPCASIFTP